MIGSLMSLSPAPLSEEISEWLARKPTRSVVYVSMGSMATLSRDNGRAILEGVMKTNYSLLWSLRRSNQWILETPRRGFGLQGTPSYLKYQVHAVSTTMLY